MTRINRLKIERLLNGLYLVEDIKSGLRCLLNSDFTIRSGDLFVDRYERLLIREHYTPKTA
jgi:hypothetical protein